MSKSSFSESPEQVAFRAHCVEWLRNNKPEEAKFRLPSNFSLIIHKEQLEYFRRWQKKLYEAGLIACDYPKEYGGGGLKDCQRIANQEMRKVGAPFAANFVGLCQAAPAILFHASEDLKSRLLPKIFSGDEIWCQGFSEPQAGSDLPGLQTSAERKADHWIINGHKIWTSMGSHADWIFMLCRTDKADKYGGITFFVVPIREHLEKGVKVRPIVKISGVPGFNEVLFEDVIIPDSYRVGDVGAGWDVAQTSLMHEREAGEMTTPSYPNLQGHSSTFSSPSMLLKMAKEIDRYGRKACHDAVVMDRLAKLFIKHAAFRNLNRRSKVPALSENRLRLSLQSKLLMTEILQETYLLATEIEGAAAILSTGDNNAPYGGGAMLGYLDSFGATIAGGTNEIQRNILGEKVLGLPKTK